jgi:FdhD protein
MIFMKHTTRERRIIVVRGQSVSAETVRFAHEHPLSLALGGQVVTVLMATPGRERELAAGYALTMGWARSDDPPPAVAFDAAASRVDMDLRVPPERLGGARAAGGGLLGPTEADPLPEIGRAHV